MSIPPENDIRVMHIASGDVWGGAESQLHLLLSGNKCPQTDKELHSCALLFNKGLLQERLTQDDVPVDIAEESTGLTSLYKIITTIMMKRKPNLLVAHGYKEALFACIFSYRRKIPWILQVHGNSENYTGFARIKSALYMSLQFFLARRYASKIIFVSKKLKIDLGFTHHPKAVVIHNAAETPREPGSPSAKSKGESIKLLWIGRMSPIKRLDILLEGYALFHKTGPGKSNTISVSLHIAGDGPVKAEIQRLVLERKIPGVEFHGFINEPFQLHTDNTILLLTSDSEGIPTVILEAVHAKTPVITRNVGGISEIKEAIPEYPVHLINDNKPETLANTLHDLIPKFSELKSKALKCESSYFNRTRMQEEHLRIYLQTLQNT
jgi:glycosyltransferase involved in cell wall biosynthesis